MTREHGLWLLGGIGSVVVVALYVLAGPKYQRWLDEQQDRETVARWNDDHPVS